MESVFLSTVFNEKGFKAEMLLENGTNFLLPEDRKSIENALRKKT